MSHKPEEFVKIAKDVLKRLRYLTVRDGNYVRGDTMKVINKKDDARKHLPRIEKACRVCAKGALFLSHIRVNDKIDMGKILGDFHTAIVLYDEDVCQPLLSYVSQDQLDLVETAFEMRDVGLQLADRGLGAEATQAINFGLCYLGDDKARLKAICQNIIDNEGWFKPQEEGK